MKAKAFRTTLLIAALTIIATPILLQAAPSLPITKAPVAPNNLTGPMSDPTAIDGQWFLNNDGIEKFRTHEFYDNVIDHGGGSQQSLAINGKVSTINGGIFIPGQPISLFDVDAIIFNDTPSTEGPWADGSNSHEEFLYTDEHYIGTLVDTKLTAEFAISDPSMLPAIFNPPYRDRPNYIIAKNEDQQAWYCWNPDSQPDYPGNYYVPTWDFGDIPVDQSAYRLLKFSVNPPMDPGDPRYAAITESFESGKDIFANRTTSLKISTWIDELSIDTGIPYLEEPLRGSDVSVFHNTEEEEDLLDWGDAPDRPYPTLAINNGAYHFIVAGAPYFDDGSQTDQPDPEPDGQQDPNALGDDNDYLSPPNDDEDGIGWPVPLFAGQPSSVTITVAGGVAGGYVDAWIDFNGNGSWLDLGELIYSGWMPQGPNVVNFLVPLGFSGRTFARFRINSAAVGLPPTGGAPDGEVEDHEVFIEEELQEELDWGDAPDRPYPTLAINNGAYHFIVAGAPYFDDGSQTDQPDPEPDGQPDPNAMGDDNDGNDDEDGIIIPVLTAGQPGSVTITVAGGAAGGYVDAWIDFNGNGVWEASERIYSGWMLQGPNPVSFIVPLGFSGQTFARFRINSQAAGLPPTGGAQDGEVEDHEVFIEEEQEELDWGDAPDFAGGASFNTLAANSGANHTIVPGIYMGASIDAELDGQPTMPADGDDLNGVPNDEDGVAFPSALIPGQNAQFIVTIAPTAPPGGTLDVWLDVDQNGNWLGPNDYVWSGPVNPGPNPVNIPFPYTMVPGQSYMRFRYNTGGPLPVTGWARDGEVEDYAIHIEKPEFDWGDAPDRPYPTLSGSIGANHIIATGVLLGSSIDPEFDGQPDPNALGDDNDGNDDEDGIVFVGKIIAGSNCTINVVAGSAGGNLDAWIDFDANGTWNHPGEHLWNGMSQPLLSGPNSLAFTVPGLPAQALGQTFARFRISSVGGLPPDNTGILTPDGEVEDYMVDLFQPAPTNLVITNLTFLAGNTNAVVEWISQTNITYQMQATTNLMVSNSFVDVEAQVVGPNNSETNNMASETNKFYRVTAPWTP